MAVHFGLNESEASKFQTQLIMNPVSTLIHFSECFLDSNFAEIYSQITFCVGHPPSQCT